MNLYVMSWTKILTTLFKWNPIYFKKKLLLIYFILKPLNYRNIWPIPQFSKYVTLNLLSHVLLLRLMKFLVIKTNLPLLVISVFRWGKLDFQYKISSYLILKLTVKKHWNMIIILGGGQLCILIVQKLKCFRCERLRWKSINCPNKSINIVTFLLNYHKFLI